MGVTAVDLTGTLSLLPTTTATFINPPAPTGLSLLSEAKVMCVSTLRTTRSPVPTTKTWVGL